jgi:nitrate reductase NapE component
VQAKIGLFCVSVGSTAPHGQLLGAAAATGGAALTASTDRDIHVQLIRLFGRLRSPDRLPVDNESLLIDADIREAVIAATKKPGTALALIGPSGRTETAAKHGPQIAWYRSDLYDLITLHRPAAGAWSLRSAVTASSFVFVSSDLVLKSTLTGTAVPAGSVLPFTLWLERQGSRLSASDLPAPSFFAEIAGPDGRSLVLQLPSQGAPDQAAGSLALTTPGEHRVRLLARSAAFQRERLVTLFVTPQTAARADSSGDGRSAAHGRAEDQEEGFSWLVLLFRFFAVNIAVAVVGAAGFSIRLLLIKMRSRR